MKEREKKDLFTLISLDIQERSFYKHVDVETHEAAKTMSDLLNT